MAATQQAIPDQLNTSTPEVKEPLAVSNSASNVSNLYAERRQKAERIYALLVKEFGPEVALNYMEEMRDEFRSSAAKDFDSILPAYSALKEFDVAHKTKFAENKDMMRLLADPLVQSFVCSVNSSQKHKRDDPVMKERSTIPFQMNQRSIDSGATMSVGTTAATDIIDSWFAGMKLPGQARF